MCRCRPGRRDHLRETIVANILTIRTPFLQSGAGFLIFILPSGTKSKETGTAFVYSKSRYNLKLMKKIWTVALVAVLTIVGQAVMAQGNSHAKGKRPEFVNEKHRAHAEWKREKEYAKKHKKYKKHHRDDDDRWDRDDDRRRDREWERNRDRDRRDYPWGRTAEQRRVEERRRVEEQRRIEERRRDEERNSRTIRDVILGRTDRN